MAFHQSWKNLCMRLFALMVLAHLAYGQYNQLQVQRGKLIANDGAAGDWFGWSAALSADGSVALIGAQYKTIGINSQQGAAYLFVNNGSMWVQAQRIVASDGEAGDRFGYSQPLALSFDGSVVVVGTCNKTIGGNDGQGAAYVFVRNGSTGTWAQAQRITSSDGEAGDQFGKCLVLSSDGRVAFVGATDKAIAGISGRGAVDVLVGDGSTWQQVQRITAIDGAMNDYFGFSVALSSNGSVALVGAYAKNIGSNTRQGAAYVFEHNGTSWELVQRLNTSDGAVNDNFGFSGALSSNGTVALVGAFYKTIGSNFWQGAAYLFGHNGSAWTQLQRITASDGATLDLFGRFVALSASGSVALVGADTKNIDNITYQGAVYEYVHNGSAWEQRQRFTASGGAAYDIFGVSGGLSSDGSVALVGAYGTTIGGNASQGSAYIFANNASASPTSTASASLTPTASSSRTLTPTRTSSSSSSSSSSSGSSSSNSSSSSTSSSISVAGTPTPTSSPSATHSASRSCTVSGSIMATDSHTSTITAITTTTTTTSPTETTPASVSATTTPVATATPTPSVPATDLWFTQAGTSPAQLAPFAARVSAVVLVVDSLPPITTRITAKNCRTPCVLACTTSDVATGNISPPTVELQPEMSSSATYAPVNSSTGTSASASLQVWAPFNSCQPAAVAVLQCSTTTSDTPGLTSSASLTLGCAHTRWPLLEDAIVLHQGGMLKSAWLPSINVTQVMLEACHSHNISVASCALFAATPSLAMQPVIAAVRVLLAHVHSASISETTAFSQTLTAGASVVLVARPLGNNITPFTNTTLVRLGAAACDVSWVSDDGLLMLVQLPQLEALCPGLSSISTADCGYRQLSITTRDDSVALGATLACPPFCPHDFPGTVPAPVASSIDNASIITSFPAIPCLNSPPTPLTLIALPSTGFYITQACTAAGYLSPSSGACANASDPRHVFCAFGAGAMCRPCPVGALCPGGSRAWPLPGYTSPTETSGDVQPCLAPALARCLGWNATMAAVKCGASYLQGSHACSGCSRGYYATTEGSCTACPASVGLAAAVTPLAVFLGGLAAASILLYCAVLALAKAVGAPTADTARNVLQLASWTFATVQLVAQEGRAAAPGLSPLLLSAYNQLAVFQFRGITLPSACIPGFPFANQMVATCLALCLLLLNPTLHSEVCMSRRQTTLGCTGRRTRIAAPPLSHTSGGTKLSSASSTVGTAGATSARGDRQATAASRIRLIAQRLAFVALTLVYAPAVNATLELLACTPAQMTVSGYLTLDQDGSTLRRAGLLPPLSLQEDPTQARSSALLTVSLLRSNPSHVCYESSHTPAAAIAWITLFVCGVAYPLAVLLWVRRRMRTLSNGKPTTSSTSSAERLESKLTAPPFSLASSRTDIATADSSCSGRASCWQWLIGSLPPASQLDASEAILQDTALAPFVRGDYRPSAYAFYTWDRYSLLALAAIGTVAGTPVTVAAVAGKLAATALVLLCGVIAFSSQRPFPTSAAWKLVVKLYSLALSLLAAVLNFIVVTAPASDSVQALSYIVFGGSVGLFFTLLVAFVLTAVRPPPTEKPLTFSHKFRGHTSHFSTANPLTGARKSLSTPVRPSIGSARSPTHQLELTHHGHFTPATLRGSRRVIGDAGVDATQFTGNPLLLLHPEGGSNDLTRRARGRRTSTAFAAAPRQSHRGARSRSQVSGRV